MAALRWLLAIVVGLAVGFGVSIYVNGPKWQQRCDDEARDPFISADGRDLYTCHGLQPKASAAFHPHLIKWDLATGKHLGEVPIDWQDNTGIIGLSITKVPGDKRLLVGSQVQKPWIYYVHDAETGKLKAGPIRPKDNIHAISNGGRWFVTHHGNKWAPVVHSFETGDAILNVAGEETFEHWFPRGEAFSPQGDRIAILIEPVCRTDPFFIQICELPSGRVLHKLELPDRIWSSGIRWELDDRLYISWPESQVRRRHYHRRCVSVSMSADDLGALREEPLRSGDFNESDPPTFWDSGRGWVAQIQCLRTDRTLPEKILGWTDSVLKTTWAPGRTRRSNVTIFDPVSHREMACIPCLSLPITISEDGRYVVECGSTIRVWSVPPPRGWLWGVVVGTIVALGVLFVGRRRKVRTVD